MRLRPGFSAFPFNKSVEEFIEEEFTEEIYNKVRYRQLAGIIARAKALGFSQSGLGRQESLKHHPGSLSFILSEQR